MASQGLARRPKAAYFSLNPARLANVWTKGRDERLDQLTELHREVVSNESLADDPDQFADIEVGFSTWGFPREAVIANLDRFPNLKAIFYAAGSVKGWAGPILEHGIRVMSAWRANAIPVAEFTFAQIILANKNY